MDAYSFTVHILVCTYMRSHAHVHTHTHTHTHAHTRTCTHTHMHTHAQGSVVEAKMTDGTVYEGILTAYSPKLEISLDEVHDKAKVNSAIVLSVRADSLSLSLSLSPSLV